MRRDFPRVGIAAALCGVDMAAPGADKSNRVLVIGPGAIDMDLDELHALLKEHRIDVVMVGKDNPGVQLDANVLQDFIARVHTLKAEDATESLTELTAQFGKMAEEMLNRTYNSTEELRITLRDYNDVSQKVDKGSLEPLPREELIKQKPWLRRRKEKW